MKVWGVVGWKDTGKTGLVTRLVAEFTDRGYAVSTIKHGHHAADVDHPGTDSFRHREAGAQEVLLATSARVALVQELRGAAEPSLADLLGRLASADLVLVEGYKRATHPKIECARAGSQRPLIADTDAQVRAVASDTHLEGAHPVFALDDTGAIADFIAKELGL